MTYHIFYKLPLFVFLFSCASASPDKSVGVDDYSTIYCASLIESSDVQANFTKVVSVVSAGKNFNEESRLLSYGFSIPSGLASDYFVDCIKKAPSVKDRASN